MICLDNSDWMRNGDYAPSRMEAQKDAAGLICNDRTGSNPENTVGLLTMAGQGVDLLVSPTEESGKFLAAFSRIHIGGQSDLATAVQIAQLALKHRKNKNGGQRIIAFVGGPITDTVEALKKIGKVLKKNEVGVDIISMGEIEDNEEKLAAFIETVNKNDNSHLITIPSGVSPVNAVISSPVMHGSAGMGGGMGGGPMDGSGGGGGDANFDMYGGINPEDDPELAMAIRASTEEARAQEEARTKAAGDNSVDVSGINDSMAASSSSSSSSSSSLPSSPVPFGGFGNGFDEEDEEALMQRALEMSMKQMMTAADSGGSSAGQQEEEMDEDEELRLALAMSTADSSSSSANDSDFVSQLLGTVDQSDPLVAAALAQLNAVKNTPKEGEEDKEGGESGKDKEGGANGGGTKRKGDDM